MTDTHLITDSTALAAFCGQLSNDSFVALDTEFIRETTYYPKLCLLQLAGSSAAAAVDPLAPNIDLAPLYELLINPKVLKVLHAGRQDLEIFHLRLNRLPAPLFDTQIGAQALGLGEAISYSDAVREFAGATIDKGARFTDWARRPLTDRQLVYALADVTHLRTVYTKMVEKLEKCSRSAWVADEMRVLEDVSIYTSPPEDAWKRLKHGNLPPKQLAALRGITAWRETEAMRKDVPRGRIIRDEMLVELARQLPESVEEITQMRGMERYPRGVCESLLKAMQAALATSPDDWPRLARRNSLSPQAADLAEMLTLLLKLVSRKEAVLPRMIATREELEQLAGGERDIRPLSGWRYTLFGRHAERLVAGELGLRFDPVRQAIALDEHQ